MGELRDFGDTLRETIRDVVLRSSPPVERYRVVSTKPLTLEAFGSDLRLEDGDAGFDLAPRLRSKAKMHDTVFILTDEHGDKIALGLSRSAEEEDEEGPEGGGAVDSVYGRIGVVVAEPGDYDVSEITGAAAQSDLESETSDRISADEELAADIATKQDSATAATDAELAAHAADTTAIHGITDTSKLAVKAEVEAKQDASTAATDAELATETTGREAADAAEKGLRESADATEKTKREEADAAEKAAREAADSLLATKTELSALLGANDAVVFKGVIDCSASPNYPAADAGHFYKVSVAGKIGGAAGIEVDIGDMLLCLNDGTAAGNQATVGSKWNVTQANLVGAVTGPTSATSGNLMSANGTSGKIIKDAGVATSTDGTLSANSNAKLPTEQAVRTRIVTEQEERETRDSEIEEWISAIEAEVAGKQAALGFTAENVANKDTDATLAANSNTKYPSQKAVKGFVETQAGLLVPKSLVDAKGDLLIGTANDTVGRLAIGSTGEIATVAGGQVAWAVNAAITKLEEAGLGVKVHGAEAGAARPTGFLRVVWIGSVEPTNALSTDIYLPEGLGSSYTDWGLVTALPSTPSIGDVCKYWADKTNGIIWWLIYTKENETYPWNFIGGHALRAEDAAVRTTASPTMQTTGAPSITAPLKMQFKARHGARYSQKQEGATAANSETAVFIDGTQTDVGYMIMAIQFAGAGIDRSTEMLTVAAGKAIQTRYAAGTSIKYSFNTLFLEVTPVRVG